MIFPRLTRINESTFDVTGAGTFALGSVRDVGDPHQKSFRSARMASATSDDGENESECEDGVDAATGEVCVDDDANEVGETCDASERDDEEGDRGDEEGGVDCEDGIDTATGAECDGGPAANAKDEPEGDEAESADSADDEVPTDAAVADHNLSGTVGCGEDQDDDNGADCEDCIDTASGLECDGGPDANDRD